MSPILSGCALCGMTIGSEEDPIADESTLWRNEFRGLYHSLEGLVLTGVGVPNERGNVCSAPQDAGGRWDDEGYEKGNEDDDFGVMRQQPIKGRYGFVFHDACWSLLAAAYHPESVPLQRLYDACRSVPIDRSVLDWGHDYGGMISRYSDAAYSWETASFGREVKLPFVDDNPFIAPQVQHPFDHGPADDLPGLASEPQRWPVSQDPFSQLPEELLVAIAELLPTKDFLSSRLASPAFFPAFNNQSFWHSRFTHTRIGERSWLFEARDYRTARVDWRWLYRQTASSRLEPGLLNRKRIWDLVGRLRPVLGLYQGPIMESSEEASYSWVGAAAELYDLDSSYSGRWFDEGAKAIFRTSVILPTSQPFHFVFYFITLGDARFICGIELIADKANEGHLLGYRSAASMSCYDPANTSSKLTGFILAIHPRGFRAVRLLYEKGDMPSQWYGDAQHCPRTQRASVSGPVSAMRVSFDGCKLVSIEVAQASSSEEELEDTTKPPLRRQPLLRHRGLWFPEAPSARICLNEISFPQLEPYTELYNPLVWVYFGGPRGSLLQDLIKITVMTTESFVGCIQFHYTVGDSTHVGELGRPPHDADEDMAEIVKMQDFDIDGPGGERIQSITIFLTYYHGRPSLLPPFNHGCLSKMKVSTNRGRSRTFGTYVPPPLEGFEATEVHLRPKDGTVITGFYAGPIRYPNRGLAAIGLMSEEAD